MVASLDSSGRGRGNFSPQNNMSQTNTAPTFNGSWLPSIVTCQICQKYGQNALDCYNRMNYSYQGRHPPTKLAAMAASTTATSHGLISNPLNSSTDSNV